MTGFKTEKYGDVTFLVFQNGMISVDHVRQMTRDNGGFNIATSAGWVVMKPLKEEPNA